MSCHNAKYRRVPLPIRIIAAILVIAFFTQDIAWAHPDSSIPTKSYADNKLAAEYFSRDESSVGKALVRGVDELILKRAGELAGRAQDELSLGDIKGAVFFIEENTKWFRDSNLTYQIDEDEVIVKFPQGYSLRYFTYNSKYPNIEKDAQGKTITTKLISRKTLLYKQLRDMTGEDPKGKIESSSLPSTAPEATRTRQERLYPYADWSAVERIVPDIVKAGGVARPRLVIREEEIALFIEAQRGNRAARDVLIEVNLPLVRAIANKFIKSPRVNAFGISWDELFSVGVSGYENRQGGLSGGLDRTVDLYDPGRGFKFSTYAYRAVKVTMIRHIERVAKTAHNIRANFPDLWQRVLGIEDSNKDAREADRRTELIDFIFHEIAPQVLNRRQREIVRDYFGLKQTPGKPAEEKVERIPKSDKEIARGQGVSKQRIAQIRMATLQKLHRAIPLQIIKELGLASDETSRARAVPASSPDLSPNVPKPESQDMAGENLKEKIELSPLPSQSPPNPNGVYIEYSYGKPLVDFSLNTPSANPWKHEVREGFKVGTGAYPREPADFLPIIEHAIREDKSFLEKSFKNIFDMSLDRTAIDNIRVAYLHKGGLKYTFSVNVVLKDKRAFTFCVKTTYPNIDQDDRINLINSLMRWERAGRKAAQYIAAYGAHTTVYAGDFKSQVMVISQEYVYGPMLLDILEAKAIPFANRAGAVRDAVDSCLEGHKACGISIWDPRPGNLCLVYNSQRDWKLVDMDKIVTGEEYGQVTIRYREQYLEILANYYEEYLDFSTAELACNWAGIPLRTKEGVYEKAKKAEDLIAEFAARNGLDAGVRERLTAVTTAVVTQMFADNKNGVFAARFVKDDARGAGVRLIARSYGNGIEFPETLKEINLADNATLESMGKRWERRASNGFKQIGPSRVESGARIGLTIFLRDGLLEKTGVIPMPSTVEVQDRAKPDAAGMTSFGKSSGRHPERSRGMALAAIHDRHRSLIETEPVPSERRILLSANLFRGGDGNSMDAHIEETENRLALEAVLNKANISILEPDEMRKQVVKNNIDRNNLTIVMTDTDYEAGKILNASEKTSWTKSGVLILRDRLTGANYLYLEGVVGLAKAMMRDDELAIKAFYRILTGQVLSDEIADIAKKNPIAFAVKAILKFKPITPKDPGDLDRSRKRMESYLVSA
ncbi:MAG: sigma-70 family RNA polymerase sigma factor [Candidatus Omnitrophota bacterium]|nr:sigma-70 family RNA polymerase sigma factor [Candidatus Omnitrophota bacterium]